MAPRFGAGSLVLWSRENGDGTHCVDLFRRADGSFGFESFRRDPEDQGRWTVLGHFSALRYDSEGDAQRAAIRAIPWLASAG